MNTTLLGSGSIEGHENARDYAVYVHSPTRTRKELEQMHLPTGEEIEQMRIILEEGYRRVGVVEVVGGRLLTLLNERPNQSYLLTSCVGGEMFINKYLILSDGTVFLNPNYTWDRPDLITRRAGKVYRQPNGGDYIRFVQGDNTRWAGTSVLSRGIYPPVSEHPYPAIR